MTLMATKHGTCMKAYVSCFDMMLEHKIGMRLSILTQYKFDL